MLYPWRTHGKGALQAGGKSPSPQGALLCASYARGAPYATRKNFTRKMAALSSIAWRVRFLECAGPWLD